MNLEQDTAPTGFYNALPRFTRKSRRGRPRIGPLRPGLLKAVGYDVTASKTRRRAAVKRAVKKYGRSSTIKKLNAVAVLTRRTSPAKSKRFKADMRAAQSMKGGDLTTDLEALKMKAYEVDELEAAPAELVEEADGLGVDVSNLANAGDLVGRIKSKLSELARQK
jgi:hypothetical protein